MAMNANLFPLPLPLLSLVLLSSCLLCSAFTSKDYSDALEKSILFFEGQRSGKLPSNQRLTWRGDSGLSDGSSSHVLHLSTTYIFLDTMVSGDLTFFWILPAQVDLTGGYYDAGDNVKFGLPMAFTTTLLAWSEIEFGGSMPGQIQNARAAVRWSADYLLKAATVTPGTLYVQVSYTLFHCRISVNISLCLKYNDSSDFLTGSTVVMAHV